MILLSGIAQSLELLTGGAQSTDWTSSYVDITTTTFAPSSNQGNVAAAVATTIIPAPLSSVTRQVKMLSVRNRDGGSPQTVTIQKNVSGTKYRITGDVVLQAGESMQYVDGDGFTIFDSNGQVKLALPPYPLPANPSALVHLTASNGVANTFMRSDAAPALDVTIVPTWTGAHTFLGAVNGANFVNFTDGTQVMGAFTTSGPTQACFGTTSNHSFMLVANARVFLTGTAAGNVTIPAPTSGVAFLATGITTTVAQLNGGTSLSAALLINAPTTSFFAATAYAQAGTTTGRVGVDAAGLLIVGSSAGDLVLRADATNILFSVNSGSSAAVKIDATTGHVTFTASSGLGVSVTTNAAGTIGGVKIGSPANPAGWFDVGGASPVIRLQDNGAAGAIIELFATNTVVGFNANFAVTSIPMSLRINTVEAIGISVNRNVSVGAPVSGQTFTVAPSPAAGELIATSSALTTGAGASAGTLTNAPSAGNPTKWIKINDNGTVRSVPAW